MIVTACALIVHAQGVKYASSLACSSTLATLFKFLHNDNNIVVVGFVVVHTKTDKSLKTDVGQSEVER